MKPSEISILLEGAPTVKVGDKVAIWDSTGKSVVRVTKILSAKRFMYALGDSDKDAGSAKWDTTNNPIWKAEAK